MPRRALITGVLGQDGSYLSEFLKAKDYEVFGTSSKSLVKTASDWDKFILEIQPQEVYLLAAHHQSSQRTEKEREPLAALPFFENNFTQPYMILESLRRRCPEARVFVAGSCHMFGETKTCPQTEETSFSPTNYYGVSKLALWQTCEILNKQGMKSILGILYNHESPKRSGHFLSTRIAQAAAQASLGRNPKLSVGSLEAQVDWGYAPDYVEAMWSVLQKAKGSGCCISR